jgi:hypothetical protein
MVVLPRYGRQPPHTDMPAAMATIDQIGTNRMGLACSIPILQLMFTCTDPSIPPDMAAANPAPEQVEFCGIIDDQTDQYRPLYEQSKKEPNGATQDRLTAQMADMFRDRKQKIMDSLLPRHFHIEEWGTHIDKLSRYAQDSGTGTGTVIELNLNANCRTKTTLQVDVVDGTPLATSLGDIKAGDNLAITGSFVMHYTDTTPPVRALEWSVTPNRAMITPEYHIEVTRFGVLPPSS